MKGLRAFFCNFNAMYLLISLCYFTAKVQIAGTQHYRINNIYLLMHMRREIDEYKANINYCMCVCGVCDYSFF